MRSGLLCLSVLALLLGGCANLGYYARSVGGHLDVTGRARPIEQVLQDPSTPAPLKAKLEAVQRIREFASRELHLPEEGYRTYADLGRPYVVWNVFAAPELSLEPKQWCFPVAGCVNYKGYFSEKEASSYAEELRAEGYEVYVGGVPAYSTLGWLEDPVLNTFIHYSEPELARLIFHELAHHVVYVSDDSSFNESFATAVEREGLEQWLAKEGRQEDREALATAEVRRAGFYALLVEHRRRLGEIYASDSSDEEKRQRKREALKLLRIGYDELKASWGGYRGYDAWLGQGPNNAQLASLSIYTEFVPGFRRLFAACNGDFPRFFQAVKGLAKLPKPERTARLTEALAQASPPPATPRARVTATNGPE